MSHSTEELLADPKRWEWFACHPHAPSSIFEVRSAMRALPEHSNFNAVEILHAILISHLTLLHIKHCRVCGCTEDYACPGCCAWANSEHNLCTSCV